VVRVPDVVVVGDRRPARFGRSGAKAKEVTVVVVGCDVLGAQLDDMGC
jgi:hypothetical protein